MKLIKKKIFSQHIHLLFTQACTHIKSNNDDDDRIEKISYNDIANTINNFTHTC